MTEPAVQEPLRDQSAPVDILASDVAFHGAVWNVRRDRFAYNGGQLVREYLDHTGAVAVLVLDEDDRVLLIQQYRHPVRQRDWEIPAGLLDVPGESPLTAAQRELAEEADLVADDWSVLAQFTSSPGSSDEAIRIFLARGVRPAPVPFERTAEEADMRMRWVPLEEAVDAVLQRRIANPTATVGVLAAHAARARGFDTLGPADEPWVRDDKAPGAA